MIREKLTVKTQPYLNSIPWLLVGLRNLIDKFNLVSKNISMILAIITWGALLIVLILNLNKKEKFDESARSILAKVDVICLLILILSISIDLISKNLLFNSSLLSSILILIAFVIFCLRGILFSYYDRKGLK